MCVLDHTKTRSASARIEDMRVWIVKERAPIERFECFAGLDQLNEFRPRSEPGLSIAVAAIAV